MDGGVVIGWSLPLWKTKKQENKKKIPKIIYALNSEKTMKTSFYCFQKSDF